MFEQIQNQINQLQNHINSLQIAINFCILIGQGGLLLAVLSLARRKKNKDD